MNAATRGVVLAIAAVVLGVIILGQGFDDPSVSVAADDTTDSGTDDTTDDAGADSETTEPDASTEDGEAATSDDGADAGDGADSGEGGEDGEATDPDTGSDGGEDGEGGETTDPDNPPVLHDPSEVRVLVVNGTSVSGAAGTVNNQLIAAGYNGLSPTNTEPIGAAESTSVYYTEGFELDARQLAQTLNAPPTSVEPLPETVPVADLQEADVVIILGPDLITG